MLKCKIASESSCGKECCCYDCKDAKNCKDKCPTYEELGKSVVTECEECEEVQELENKKRITEDYHHCMNFTGKDKYKAKCTKCGNVNDCEIQYEEVEEQTEVVTLDKKVPESIKILTDIMQQKKHIEEVEKQVRETLLHTMEQHGIKSFENDVIKLTYVAPSERKTIDSTRLKKEHPEIAEAYQKISQVKSSVKIEVK